MPPHRGCSHPVVYSISTPMETPSSPERIPCDAISFAGVQVDGNADAGIHLWGEQHCSPMPALGSDPVHLNDDGSSGMVVVDQGNAQLPEGARGSSSCGEYIPSSHYLLSEDPNKDVPSGFAREPKLALIATGLRLRRIRGTMEERKGPGTTETIPYQSKTGDGVEEPAPEENLLMRWKC
ncbi:hypothetical protein Nepgr_018833 [Nepenthes gracilis]|uniref:Uncharacterized protein n=1 Tax=Nepenthes gracilis TaxID=150966 RepID=A0AAD3XTH8_NEPGR|nr:hypothetical protein Nepgr_018833 [Nepenthes gracilis]